MGTYQRPNTKNQELDFCGPHKTRESNRKSKKIGKALAKAAIGLAMLVITVLAVNGTVNATTWYFRDSSQSLPPNPPTGDITGEPSFAASPAWISRLMTLATGTTEETSDTGTLSSTGYYRGVRFVSSPISSDSLMPAATYTVHLHHQTSAWHATKFLPTPYVYIYEWIPGTPGSRGDLFIVPTSGAALTDTSWTSQDITTVNGPNVTLNAGNYLCVDVYWYLVRSNPFSGNLYLGWGNNATYDSNLNTPGGEVPTLGFWLLLLAVALFTLFAVKKGTLKLKPAATGLLLLALCLSVGLQATNTVRPKVGQTDFYVSVADKSGKEIANFPLKPLSNTELINQAGLNR